VFGSTYLVHVLSPGCEKLFIGAIKCVFQGYSRVQKGDQCCCLFTLHFYVSTDVTYFDDTPFFVTPGTSDSKTYVSNHVVHIPLFERSISTHDLHSHIVVPSLSVIVLLINVNVLMLKRQSLPLLVIQILFILLLTVIIYI
jgi:hypothetical protein